MQVTQTMTPHKQIALLNVDIGQEFLCTSRDITTPPIDYTAYYNQCEINTKNHEIRVSRHSGSLAKQLGLSTIDIKNVIAAGLIHDRGKKDIPYKILYSGSFLTKEEFNIVKQHVELGYKELRANGERQDALNIMRQHHEKLNGTGYPFGLKDEEILPTARILAVADTFDALIYQRSYKRAYSVDEALEVIHDDKGAYDPEVITVLEKNVLKPKRNQISFSLYAHSAQMIHPAHSGLRALHT